MSKEKPIKGFKVTDKDMQCRGFQFELNKVFKHNGEIELCGAGFHFCKIVNDCFNYYNFNPENRVFEIEATGKTEHGDDKSVTSTIKLIREIPWTELLVIANTGKENTGHSNSGDRNSGNWNSGDRNSGDRNSGDRNSGDSNSGYRNSGDSNSGNWNSGNRNSGDSNSGYRNSGAFCTDNNPTLILFNKPTNILVRDWESHEAVSIMSNLETTIWVPQGLMNDEEKKRYPKYETTEGYLKTIPIKEAWLNLWHNLSDKKKAVFTSLPNFDWAIFTEITGIKPK